METKKKHAPNERTGEISGGGGKVNESEVSNLPDMEFRKMVINMLKELCDNCNSMKEGIETRKRKRTSQK